MSNNNGSVPPKQSDKKKNDKNSSTIFSKENLVILGKSLIWTFLTTLFGLLQAWLVLATTWILIDDKSFDQQFEQLILDGALLFFATAIVSSLTIDHHLSQRIPHSDAKTSFLFVLFPVIIVIICVWLFSICYGKTVAEVSFEYVQNVEYGVFTAALIYGFIVKLFAFKQNRGSQ